MQIIRDFDAMKAIKDSLIVIIIMSVINFITLSNFISNGKMLHGIGYFIFFYFSIFIISYFTKKIPSETEIEVNDPKKELFIAILFALIGMIFLTLNYMSRSNLLIDSIFIKIPIGLGTIIFAMPAGIFIYLLIKRYKILSLGLRIQPWIYILLGVGVWGFTGIFAYVFNKDGMLWEMAYSELGGVSGIILQGVIGAALVEEFSRFIIQSRFEKVYKTYGLNILVATLIWAFMHIPMTYFKGNSISETLIYCIQIIPIGFVWGFLTQKTKSFLPSTIAHGLNLWGFQNS